MDKDPKLRPLYLAQILYERTDEDHYLTTAELMEIREGARLQSPRQTIPADVAGIALFWHGDPGSMSSQKRYPISREYDIAEIKAADRCGGIPVHHQKKSEELVAKSKWLAGTRRSS